MAKRWNTKCSCFAVLAWLGSFLMIFGGLSSAGAAVLLASATNPSNGHIYHLVTGVVSPENPLGGMSWEEANRFAQTFATGGETSHLLSITSSEEEQWIKDQFADPGSDFSSPFHLFWMGLTDRADEGTFVWESGESSPYRNWSGGGIPADSEGTEDFVYFANTSVFEPLMRRGQINDHESERVFSGIMPFSAIVEIVPVPEPAVLILVVWFFPLVLRRRRMVVS